MSGIERNHISSFAPRAETTFAVEEQNYPCRCGTDTKITRSRTFWVVKEHPTPEGERCTNSGFYFESTDAKRDWETR